MKRAILPMIMLIILLLLTTTAFGQWTVDEAEDLLSGTSDALLLNMATDYQGALSIPFMVVRDEPEGEGYDIFIHWGGYALSSDTSRLYIRADNNEPTHIPTTLSVNRKATFISGNLSLLLETNELAAMTYTATGTKMVGLWDTSDLASFLPKVKGKQQ